MHKIGVIGLGMGAKPHAVSLQELVSEDRVEVVGGYARREESRRAFHDAFGFPVTDDVDGLIAASDTLIVITPPNTHLELTQKIAAAGKHVLLEKPVDVTTERAEACVKACRDAGVKLGVVFQKRFKPATLKMRELIQGGSLGAIVNAGAYMRLWRPSIGYYDLPGRGTYAQDGGGVLITQGIHTLDMMLSYTGPVAEVTAFAGNTPVHDIEVEDICMGALRFANGAMGVIDATTACYPGLPERVELVCENATAFVDGAILSVHWKDGKTESFGSEDASEGGADPMAFSHDFHKVRIEEFLDAVEQDREPMAGGTESLNVHRLIDALLLSAKERRIVSL